MDDRKTEERRVLLRDFFAFDRRFTQMRGEIIERFHWNENISSEQAARIITDEQLSELFAEFQKGWGKYLVRRNFYGRHYAFRNGVFSTAGSWDAMRAEISNAMQVNKTIADVLSFIIEGGGTVDYATLKAKFPKARTALDLLLGKDIVMRGKMRQQGQACYRVHEEIVPLIGEVIESTKRQPLSLTSEAARSELLEIGRLDREFEAYLRELLRSRLDDAVEFGRTFSVSALAGYLQSLFGSTLYFDSLLSITQQYALADVDVVNPEGRVAMRTGFNLAFFGETGTGKTFSIDDMIRGDSAKSVLPHGLPGRNRYGGGMTPARFIRIGEAYQGRKFNFILPEFNDWFKYKGMVEPLKLAMEQREIKYEIKDEVVGPYRFGSFFSVNYNTKVFDRGYEVTVVDPNFNAIEDRMLCRLHRLTSERYSEIAKNQTRLALGMMNMSPAEKIRDHLTLIYAIETGHVKLDAYPYKKILLTGDAYEKISEAREAMLSKIRGVVPFSPRLERRALQLACAFTLIGYFAKNELIVGGDALDLAVKFFISEASVRSKESFRAEDIMKKVGV